MSRAVDGQGVPEAPIYDPGVPGPHRLIILEPSGAVHPWNQDLEAYWKTSALSETELVVVVEERKESLDSADYVIKVEDRTVTVVRYRRDLMVRVLSAHTGDVLLTTTLTGPEPDPFWSTLPAGQTEIVGAEVPYLDLVDWLACDAGLGLCLRSMRRLEGHTSGVTTVAFSPDGLILASGSEDGTVRLWRMPDGALLRTLEGRGAVFSPDGGTLATASSDNTVLLRRVSDGGLLRELEGRQEAVWSVAFSPDGQTLATGYRDGIVRLWQVSDGGLLRELEGHQDVVRSVAFSPDGQTLATGSSDDPIRLWRVSDGSLLRTLEGHGKYVRCVTFSPDGQTLAAGSWDEPVRLWRVSDGAHLRTFPESTADVQSVIFSPDGQTMATCKSDIHLWRLEDGALLWTLRLDDVVGAEDIAFSPDWHILAGAFDVRDVLVWQIDGTLE